MKHAYIFIALGLALPLSAAAQDKAKPEPAAAGQATAEAAKETSEQARGAKFDAGKKLADQVKVSAGPPDHLDDDSDDDGLLDLAESAAHESTHTVQQAEGTKAAERKRPGRTKYGDITLERSADDTSTQDNEAQGEKPQEKPAEKAKTGKKKGNN